VLIQFHFRLGHTQAIKQSSFTCETILFHICNHNLNLTLLDDWPVATLLWQYSTRNRYILQSAPFVITTYKTIITPTDVLQNSIVPLDWTQI